MYIYIYIYIYTYRYIFIRLLRSFNFQKNGGAASYSHAASGIVLLDPRLKERLHREHGPGILVPGCHPRFKAIKMGVSINGDAPKSSTLIVVSLIKHLFWGTPIYRNPQMVIWISATMGLRDYGSNIVCELWVKACHLQNW